MGAAVTESIVESATLAWLEEMGFSVAFGPDIAPDSPTGKAEREHYGQVVLEGRLRDALHRLNPDITEAQSESVISGILRSEYPSLVDENRRIHALIANGVHLEVLREDGTRAGKLVNLVDYEHPENNDWLAVNQFTVIEGEFNRRPDVVIFLNGLPIGVIELKNPAKEDATWEAGFQQLQTYKQQVPCLFRTNAFLASADGLHARIGSLTADKERFMPWRTIDGKNIVPPESELQLETLIKGVCEKSNLLALLRDFTVFCSTGGETGKIVAGYHQFHAVRKALAKTVEATQGQNEGRIGVIWHTQGSGKSLLMAFYSGLLIRDPAMKNPTIVVVTDRNDLDGQLFDTFTACSELLMQSPVQALSRDNLRACLARNSGGVIFTTIQKFGLLRDEVGFPALTERRNVVVIADEAHRSQYGFDARLDLASGEVSYGFAKYMRDALPYASFIGFTGTPIESDDINTPAIFGDYIDVYDISRAVEDEATVPIFYESRLAKIELDETEKPKIDEEVDALSDIGEDELGALDQLKRKWSRVEALVGAEKRVQMVARDIVEHFEAREGAMGGKAMIVCMSRRICVAMYDEIVRLRPEWHGEDDQSGRVKVVMTGAANDPLEWQPHIGRGNGKARRELMMKRAKNTADDLKLVIVRDMWLTGFDIPCLHTMYVDKPMRGHGLMQAIARVNRVFKGKPGGLVVDYIGIAQNLKAALRDYSSRDQHQVGIDTEKADQEMLREYEIVRGMFHPFDYQPAMTGTPTERLKCLAGAMERILDMQVKDAAQCSSSEEKQKTRRRFGDAVLRLSVAFALSSASDEARRIRDEVGFFQAVKAALSKRLPVEGARTMQEKELFIQQIVSRAVVSTDIVDIMEATGLQRPDISILSDDFLQEMRVTKSPNLAIEALRRLLNGEIFSQSKTNVAKTKEFSKRLEEAIAKYHNNALTAIQVIEELILLAKDMKAAKERGAEENMSPEEIAFYDALAENENAKEAMGDKQLLVIAHSLLSALKQNICPDWRTREPVRAKMRMAIKKVLRQFGYPPDMQDSAVQSVLRQAEALAESWS